MTFSLSHPFWLVLFSVTSVLVSLSLDRRDLALSLICRLYKVSPLLWSGVTDGNLLNEVEKKGTRKGYEREELDKTLEVDKVRFRKRGSARRRLW